MNNELTTSKKISVEFVLYACILIISLALRFALLDRTPLNEAEAKLAMEAWNLAQGRDVMISGQPGYVALTAPIFYIFKTGNFLARFWPALIGSMVALLPFLFRERLGKTTALVLAVLLALDPFLISMARSANGSMIALVGLLAGIGFWYLRRPVWSGISLGLSLLGGVDLWPGLIVFALALFAAPKTLRSIWGGGGGNRKTDGRFMAISLAVTAGVIGTVFLTTPAGISSVGSSLIEYFKSWGMPAQTPYYSAAIIWLILEIPVLVFAIWGLIRGIKHQNPLTSFCGIWAGLALLLALVNHSRNLEELFWASVPLLVLAATVISQLIPCIRVESKIVFYAEAAAVIALCEFSFMNFTNLVNSNNMNPEDLRNRIIGVLLPLVLLAVVTALFAWGWSAASTRKGLLLGIGVILLAGWIGSAWKAADLGSRPEFEFTSSQGYAVGEKNLLKTVSDLSLWSTSQANRIDIQIVNIESDSLKWALRNFDNIQVEQSFNPNLSSSIILTPQNIVIESENVYRGQNMVWLSEPDFASMSVRDWAKWALFRTAPQKNTELILWANNALFP